MSNFKERYRLLWEESGMSHADFGEKLGISNAQSFRYASGGGEPKTEMLVKIANKCNVSLDWLLGLSDIRTPIDTVAAHRTGQQQDLPPEAIKSIEAFTREMYKLYGKK